jgi:hypothetical protein
MNETNALIDVWRKRSNRLTEFATLLSSQSDATAGTTTTNSTARTKSMLKLFSNSVEDHEVVMTLPSLDLGLTESSRDGDPLPVIGEHCERLAEDTHTTTRPTMAASVLTSATDGAANSEQTAAQNIGKLTSWTKSTLEYASDALKKNLSKSFASLVESRVRAWTLLLLRHSLSTGDEESRTRLLNMLSSSIQVVSSDTHFKTLPLPDAAMLQAKEGEVVLPLLFEVTLRISLQDTIENVILRAPGTITAQFEGRESHLFDMRQVAVRLTSSSLLNAMVEQARMVVLKSVAFAIKTKVPENEPTAIPGHMDRIDEHKTTAPVAHSPLSGFRSALTLSTDAVVADNETPRLQKARTSALRLNSVLHHKSPTESSTGVLGIRKIRSVKWEGLQPPRLTGPLDPVPKKPRTVNAAKLKSFKSFGRAHAEDFKAGPRNATFGEFERTHAWGRDGRLAHHPQPHQQGQGEFLGQTNFATNATFDLSRTAAPRSTQGAAGTMGMLPRTTTALEMFVLNKSTNGGKATT